MSTFVSIDSFSPAEITLQEAKTYSRVDNTEDDQLILDLVASAQQEGLGYTHVIFGAGEITVKQYGYTGIIRLPYLPFVSMDSFKLDGLDSTEYTVQGDTVFINTSFDECTFIYSAGRDMPSDVKLAMLQRVKFTYDYPDDMTYEKVRFFERVLFRYREPSTFV